MSELGDKIKKLHKELDEMTPAENLVVAQDIIDDLYAVNTGLRAEIRELREEREGDNTRLRWCNKRITILEADNDRLRAAIKPIEFCVSLEALKAKVNHDNWCPSCRGNKQDGTPTRGHYAHCPIYIALKEIKRG